VVAEEHPSTFCLFFVKIWNKNPNIPKIGILDYFDLIHLLGLITSQFGCFWLPYRGAVFVLRTLYYNATTGDGIIFDMYKVMEIITSEDTDGYFIHAGYF
jgi:hypothetical protein